MRILAYTSPARGHLYPLVPIVAELVARGHRTTVCTLSYELEHLPALGIEAWPIAPALQRSELRDWQARSGLGALRSVLSTFVERAAHEAPDIVQAIDPQLVFHELSKRLPDGAIVTSDPGSSANWFARDLKLRRGMPPLPPAHCRWAWRSTSSTIAAPTWATCPSGVRRESPRRGCPVRKGTTPQQHARNTQRNRAQGLDILPHVR